MYMAEYSTLLMSDLQVPVSYYPIFLTQEPSYSMSLTGAVLPAGGMRVSPFIFRGPAPLEA